MRLYYLAEKALSGTLSSAERHELDEWLDASLENRVAFAQIKEILDFGSLAMESVEPDTESQWAELRTATTAAPVTSPMRDTSPLRPPFWSRSRVWAAAAAVLLLITVGGYLAFFRNNTPANQPLHFATAAGERKAIKLSDGTKVTLQGGSVLDAAAGYGDKDRQLTLQGEAYFDVASDKSRPFVVSAGSTRSEALGTEFNVRMSRSDATVQLSVTEGKVRFSEANAGEIVLVAGEVAHFDPKSGKIVRETTLAQDEAAWTQSQLIFKDTPFVLAAERLENHYGMTLHFPDRLNAARLTANFDQKPLRDVLDVLEAIYSLNASQAGAVVTLSE